MPKPSNKPLTYKFSIPGEPLEAHRIASSIAPSTKWLTETYAVNYPGLTGESIDQIQIFYDENQDEWLHWPTKFITSHKVIGAALAKVRNEQPELHKYMVRCNVHEYVDLSDPPKIRYLPSEGKNPADAVLRMRQKIEEEQRDNAGIARLILRSGKPRYLSGVHMGAVREA